MLSKSFLGSFAKNRFVSFLCYNYRTQFYANFSNVVMTESDEQARERQVLEELIGDRMPIVNIKTVSACHYLTKEILK